ncbi:HTH_Tnp_Tc3_2 domain-containing protein [Trichonephila clavipes]|nr:HTH_Tnp_Tc3_2 domain-containing protein [Trichonephila clavipes]
MECGRAQLEVAGSLESPRVSSPRFNNDSKMMVMRVDVYSTGRHRVTTPNEDRYIYLAVTAKRNRRSTASDLSRQLSSAIGTLFQGRPYTGLGHIGLCARRPVRRVPLSTNHCRLRLTCSKRACIVDTTTVVLCDVFRRVKV